MLRTVAEVKIIIYWGFPQRFSAHSSLGKSLKIGIKYEFKQAIRGRYSNNPRTQEESENILDINRSKFGEPTYGMSNN